MTPVEKPTQADRTKGCAVCGCIYDEYLGFTMHENQCASLAADQAARTTTTEGGVWEALQAARDGLLREAVHMEQDCPGDVPEDCGWWCRLCNDHVDGDRKSGPSADGHAPSCPIAKAQAILASPRLTTPAVASAEVREAAETLLLAMATRRVRGDAHVPSMRDEQDAAAKLRTALAALPPTETPDEFAEASARAEARWAEHSPEDAARLDRILAMYRFDTLTDRNRAHEVGRILTGQMRVAAAKPDDAGRAGVDHG